MDELATPLTCERCGREYPVQLRRMRLNITVLCPFCALPYTIPEDRAIKAHRLLEMVESGTLAPVTGTPV